MFLQQLRRHLNLLTVDAVNTSTLLVLVLFPIEELHRSCTPSTSPTSRRWLCNLLFLFGFGVRFPQEDHFHNLSGTGSFVWLEACCNLVIFLWRFFDHLTHNGVFWFVDFIFGLSLLLQNVCHLLLLFVVHVVQPILSSVKLPFA